MSALMSFLSEGLAKYPDACIAVSTFEEELGKRVDRYIDARKDWGPFVFKGRRRPPPSGSLSGGWWLGSVVSGKVGAENVKMSLGYWWRAPGSRYAAAIASGIEEGPDAIKGFEYDGSDQAIGAIDWRGKTFLMAETPANLDPAKALDAELNLLLKVLGSM
jgi:hypothetical protein